MTGIKIGDIDLISSADVSDSDTALVVDYETGDTKRTSLKQISNFFIESGYSVVPKGPQKSLQFLSGSVTSPITDNSYTLSSLDRGKTLLFSSPTTQNITCSSGLSVGYNCTFIQMGAGQLILSASSGVELLNRQSHTGSAGQYAAVSIVVIDTNKIIVAGDTI